MNLFIVASLILLVLYLVNKYFYSYWSRRNVYQIEPTFIVGNLGSALTFKKSLGDFFYDLYNKYKSKKIIGAYMFYQPILIVNDPVLIQEVMIKSFTSFHDRPLPGEEGAKANPLVGHLFNIRGQKWRDLRVKMSPTFTSGKLKAMFPIINDCADVLQKYVEKNIQSGDDIFEMRDLFARLTTNIISSVAFGIENDCINDRDNIFRKMGMKLFEPSLRNIMTGFLFTFAPDFFAKSGIDPFGKEITDFFFSITQQTVDYREKNKFERNDFMQLLIKLKNEGYIPVDKNEKEEIDAESDYFKQDESKKASKISMNDLRANAFLFFVAGFETSSSTASFCLYELCRNPEKQRKAQQEIDRVLKAHDGKLTYESLLEMKYVDCCIDEALRKHPIVPFLFRTATQDIKIPGTQATIEKGTSVYLPILGIQRDPNIYENPLAFEPERFLNSSNGNGKAEGVFYAPFGDGPRNCIGARMGKLQSKIGLVVLLQKFNFEYADKSKAHEEIEYSPTQFVLTPKQTILIKASKR